MSMTNTNSKVRWKPLLNSLKRWRKKVVAPVDTDGCSVIRWPTESLESQKLQVLIALMLSSRTKDEVTSNALNRIHDAVDKFDVNSLSKLGNERIGELIKPVGFWRQKALYIAKSMDILGELGEIPVDFKGLTSLPGVGPKMANLFMQVYNAEDAGIGVDIHVWRISRRVGWATGNTPDKVQISLEGILPKSQWGEINRLLVGLGQMVCKAKNPKCLECPISKWCEYYKTNF